MELLGPGWQVTVRVRAAGGRAPLACLSPARGPVLDGVCSKLSLPVGRNAIFGDARQISSLPKDFVLVSSDSYRPPSTARERSGRRKRLRLSGRPHCKRIRPHVTGGRGSAVRTMAAMASSYSYSALSAMLGHDSSSRLKPQASRLVRPSALPFLSPAAAGTHADELFMTTC
jgi:hypothetical protein